MKKTIKNLTWWSGVVTLGIILGISLQFVKAWTEPTTAPPGGNLGAPINTGTITQYKQGSLHIYGAGVEQNGLFAMGLTNGVYGINSTSNNVGALGNSYFGAYGDNGQSDSSIKWGVLGYGPWAGYFYGPVYSSSSLVATSFYDVDDNNYFINPNDISRLNRIRTGNQADMGIDSFNTGKLCISGVCQTSWPTGGGMVSGGLYGICMQFQAPDPEHLGIMPICRSENKSPAYTSNPPYFVKAPAKCDLNPHGSNCACEAGYRLIPLASSTDWSGMTISYITCLKD